MLKHIFFTVGILIYSSYTYAIELVIGEERVDPGIVFIFEGAVKDHVMPLHRNLDERSTNIHIEARANWDTKAVPKGTPLSGFVPYLHISAKIINEETGLSSFIDLIPHINLIDNFHYARNMSLPGEIDDSYTVIFHILKPTSIDISLHRDWLNQYGNTLLKDTTFVYKKVDFEEIAKASRK